jgi:DNA invertase Pin-like site-specific DNA recombinase
MRVAIYTRVSTGKQDTENQAAQLRDFAAKQGWTITQEFTDVVSGRKDERQRPQFKRMFDSASRREFDLVLFWALDRFSREGVLPTLHHLQRPDGYGVAWRSFTEQYLDSTGVFKDAVISITATIAKQENIRRSERIRAGLARTKAAVRSWGGRKSVNGRRVGLHCGDGGEMADFDNLYADEFQCPLCVKPAVYTFMRNRMKDTVEPAFRHTRCLAVRQHIETYHPDNVNEFPEFT